MAKKSGNSFFDASRFTAAVRQLIESLPTEAQQQELHASFTQVIDFLVDLRTRLSTLPSQSDAESIREALSRIDDLVVKAKNNSALAGALSLPQRKPPRPKALPLTEEESARAKTLI